MLLPGSQPAVYLGTIGDDGGQLLGQLVVLTDLLIDLGHGRSCAGKSILDRGQSRSGPGPFTGGTPRPGEVQRVLGIDALHQIGLATRQCNRLSGSQIQRTGERIARGQIQHTRPCRLQDTLRFPQIHVDGLVKHVQNPLMRLVTGKLFATRLDNRQVGLGAFVESLAIHKAVRTATDLGLNLGTDIGEGGLDLFDVLLGGAILGFDKQVQGSIIEVLPTSLAPPTTTTPRSGKVMSRCVIPR